MTVVITGFAQAPRDWESQHGQFRSYYVKIEGDERTFELAQKRTTAAPNVGDAFEATVEEREHNGTTYYKLKKQQGRGDNGGGRYSEEDIARMDAVGRVKGRCHAQAQALAYAAIRASQGRLPSEFTMSDLKPIIDWFQADAESARNAA